MPHRPRYRLDGDGHERRGRQGNRPHRLHELAAADARTSLHEDVPHGVRIITALCVDAATGTVWGCGRSGLLLAGRGDVWKTRPDLRCPDDLWSLAVHGKKLFAASLGRLYAIEDDTVTLVDLGALDANSFGVLVHDPGQLWSIGEKDVMAYDGSAWSRIA